MKNASETMYRIGRIFNFILLGIYAILIVVNLVSMIVGLTDSNRSAQVSSAVSGLITNIILIALTVVLLFLAKKAMTDIEADGTNQTPHILMIVFGVLTGDVFYLLGGIFGLVAISQANNSNNTPKM